MHQPLMFAPVVLAQDVKGIGGFGVHLCQHVKAIGTDPCRPADKLIP